MNDIKFSSIKGLEKYLLLDKESGLFYPNPGPDPDKNLFPELKKRKDFEPIINRMNYQKNTETFKSAGNFVIGFGLSAAAAGVAYVVSGIALMLLGPSLAPLAIPNPFLGLILFGAGLVVGGITAYKLYQIYAKPCFAASQKHWDYSDMCANHIDVLKLAKLTRPE